ncbi:signal peptidase I [Mycetocola sp. JXN-3]|uniref:signal peptidase I n=1 Tax=Mycetocola sp. JXN-3 TaxID=2116510 RepID=UPI00165CFD1D|nr:signal peptidase I [Mycetocola sp. JXN-3]
MSTVSPPRAAARRASRRTPRVVGRRLSAGVGNLLLNLAAVAGSICIVLVILAFVFHTSLIMFKTGSMAPTIPTGSVALVREIPATEVRVGDVLTVDRIGQLPITHRVTSVSDGPTANERVITMRGDANASEDPAPYTITSGRIVLGSVPHLATVIVWFGNPWVLGSLTIALSGLVTWAFWPRRVVVKPAAKRRGRHAAAAAAVALALLSVGTGALLPASPARAEGPEETTLTARTFTLVSVADTYRMANLAPGVPVTWDLGVNSRSTGPVTVSMAATGGEELGLVAGITECDQRWQGSSCASGTKSVSASAPLVVDGVQRPVSDVPAGLTRWYRVTVSMPQAPAPAAADTAASRVVLRFSDPDGEVIEVPGEPGTTPSEPTGPSTLPPDAAWPPRPGGDLPFTGWSGDVSRLLLAGLAIGTGMLIAGIARLRTRDGNAS